MKIIATIVILALLAGGGFWIWKVQHDKDTATPNITTSIKAFNQTKNVDATTVPASPLDIIVYTLTVENKSDKASSGYVTEVNIGDVSDAAVLVDAQGASYNSASSSLVWTPLDVPANGSFDKKFTVRIKDTQSANSDYVMSTKFNNDLAVNIAHQVAVAPTPTPNPTGNNPTPTPTAPFNAPTTGPTGLIVFLIALGITFGAGLLKLAKFIGSR